MIDVKPWMLPAIVLVLIVPITVAFLTLGPLFGLLVGGAVGAALVLTAIRLGSEAPRRRHRPGGSG